MTSNGQDTPASTGAKIRRIMLGCACALVGVPMVGAASVVVGMAFGPVPITPFVRPFLPLTVIPAEPGRPPHARLWLGRATLRWNILRDGLDAPVALSLGKLRIAGATGQTSTIGLLEITLEPHALLQGVFAPRVLNVHNAHLALRRGHDGTIGLDFDPAPDTLPQGDNTPLTLSALEHACVDDTTVTMNDQLTGTHWTAAPMTADLHLHTAGGHQGVVGTAAMTITPDNQPDRTMRLTTSGTPTDKGIVWRLTTSPLTLTTFANIQPALATMDVPFSLSAEAQLVAAPATPWLLPGSLTVWAKIGAGHLAAGGSTYQTDHGTLGIRMVLDHSAAKTVPMRARLLDTELVLRHPLHPTDPDHELTVRLGGWLDASDLLHPTHVTGALDTDIPQVAFTDLDQYWPSRAAKGGKAWVNENITAGMASGLHTQVRLASSHGWNALKIAGLDGSLEGKGLTVHWLRPITPLQGMNARLEIHDLDTLTIDFQDGYQQVGTHGRIAAGPGRMTISGLSEKDQTGTITSALAGRLDTILALLAEPRLHLLSRHPLDVTNPRGKAAITLKLTLPLISRVKIDDMTINAHADISNAALGNVVAGRGITNGRFTLDTSTDGLSLSGTGTVSGLPSTLCYSTDFRHVGPQETLEQAHLTSRLTPATVAAAGFDTGDHFDGSANLDVAYLQTGDHHGTVKIALDLAPALIRIPLWHKAAGRPAKASATLGLDHGHIASVENINASGPDLSIQGQAQMRPKQPPELVISSFRVARSVGRARLVLPAQPHGMIHVGVQAESLDLSPFVSGDLTNPKPEKKTKPSAGYHVPEAATGKLHGPPGLAWAIDVTAKNLWYAQNKPPLRGISAYFEDNGLRLERMRFSMRAPTPVSMTLTPKGQKRALKATIPDMGAFLAAFNILPDVRGGRASLVGTFDDSQASAPFSGQLNVSPFVLTKAPTALRVARNISFYGWLASQDTSTFEITHLTMPVTFEDGTLNIHDARTGNTALGATLEGAVNLERNSIDLQGTVVPLFAINKLPGKLPGIGRLFSPETDGGLLALTFGISGKLEDPTLHINPYSILLPGMLRRMF